MLAGPLLDDCTEELLDGVIELLATELLDFTELLDAMELLDGVELLAISELLEISELLATSELLNSISTLLEASDELEASVLDVLEGAALEESVGSVARLAATLELAIEDTTATFEDAAFADEAFIDDTDDLAVLVGFFDPPLPPPHALNTTVSDKAVKALNVYKVMFSIMYLYCVMPHTKGEFIVSCKNQICGSCFYTLSIITLSLKSIGFYDKQLIIAF